MGKSVRTILKNQVPTLIVGIYGLGMLALIFFICLLLREDMIQLQNYFNEKLGIENAILKINFSAFDDHFNKILAKSLEYLQT